jgi:hypothetical protein
MFLKNFFYFGNVYYFLIKQIHVFDFKCRLLFNLIIFISSQCLKLEYCAAKLTLFRVKLREFTKFHTFSRKEYEYSVYLLLIYFVGHLQPRKA